jgi:hypothetical protein
MPAVCEGLPKWSHPDNYKKKNETVGETMKKNTLLFGVDIGMFVLLVITILTALPEAATHSFIHIFSGILLTAGALLHIGLHWGWIKNALMRFTHLPRQARTNACLDLALFYAYIACGVTGLVAQSFLIFLPLHVFLSFMHALLGVLVIFLQIAHLAYHWRWVTTTVRRMIENRKILDMS